MHQIVKFLLNNIITFAILDFINRIRIRILTIISYQGSYADVLFSIKVNWTSTGNKIKDTFCGQLKTELD